MAAAGAEAMESTRYAQWRASLRGATRDGIALRRHERHGTAIRGDRGISTIEVVVLAPIMILFILVLVAFGQLVDGRGAVDGAARDAARAGSLQRDQGSAMDQARAAAEADLDGTCVSGTLQIHQLSGQFQPGTLYTVQVTCQIRGLASLGLDIRKTITSQGSAPLDPYRRAVS